MDVDTLYGIQRFLEAYEGGRKVSLQPGGEEGRIEEGDPVSLRYFKGDWYVLVRTDSDGEVHRYGPEPVVEDISSEKPSVRVPASLRERWEEETSFGIRRDAGKRFSACFLADPRDRRMVEKLLDGKAVLRGGRRIGSLGGQSLRRRGTCLLASPC